MERLKPLPDVLQPDERNLMFVRMDYGDTLAGVIPYLRNAFAHPKMHSTVAPGQALFQLRLTAEFVNQLFAKRT